MWCVTPSCSSARRALVAARWRGCRPRRRRSACSATRRRCWDCCASRRRSCRARLCSCAASAATATRAPARTRTRRQHRPPGRWPAAPWPHTRGPMPPRRPLHACPRRGYAHTFAFAGRPSSRRAAPTTLLGLDAARCPGPAQFAPALVARELTKAHAGFAALARSGARCCETGLWGCEGAQMSPGAARRLPGRHALVTPRPVRTPPLSA